MTIDQQPPSLCFVGNLKDIILTSEEEVISFIMTLDGDNVISEDYIPDNDGKIRIPIEHLIDEFLSVSVPPDNLLYEQTLGARTFGVTIEDDVADPVVFTFIVIKGGVDRKSLVTADFVRENFLTWQPQTKYIRSTDINFLSYYVTAAAKVFVKAYFTGGSDETIELHDLPDEGLFTFGCGFTYINSLFETQPIYYDIFVQSVGLTEGEPDFVSFTQRYVLTDKVYDFDDHFVFENSLGGIDSIRFSGEKKLVNANKFDIGLFFDEISDEYQVNPDKAFEKNTGYFRSKAELNWSQDFFSSKQKYLQTETEIVRILTKDPELSDIKHQIAAADFVFIFTEQTKYIDGLKALELIDLLTIIGPNDEEYYLVPRLWTFPEIDDPTLAIWPVQKQGEPGWKSLTYQNLINAIFAGQYENLMAAFGGTMGTPGPDNKFVTEESLADLGLSVGAKVFSANVTVTSNTTGLVDAEWRDAEGDVYTLTAAPITFIGLPSSGLFRWDSVELRNNGTVAVISGTPDAEAVKPSLTAGSQLAGEVIWSEDGLGGSDPYVPSVFPEIRFSTQIAPGTNGKFAKMWEGDLSTNENFQLHLAYGSPSSSQNWELERPGKSGYLILNFLCDPDSDILPNNVQFVTVDKFSVLGDFRLVQLPGNRAALLHYSSDYWMRVQFRVVFSNSAFRNVDFINDAPYEALPAGTVWQSEQYGYEPPVEDYIPTSGNTVSFETPNKYGYDGTPVTGNLTISITDAKEINMAKVLHSGPEPTISVPGGVTLHLSGGTHDPAKVNEYLWICHKNNAGTVTRISYTVSPNLL